MVPAEPDRVYPSTPPPALVAAQAVAHRVAAEIGPSIVPGVTELELTDKINELCNAYGSTGQWTPVTTRVGLGTLVAHPDFPMQARAAALGDTAFIDVTPTIDGWLGDHCVSYIVGGGDDPESPARRLLEDCRWVQEQMIEASRPGMPANELFAVGAELLRQRGLKLLDLLDNFGHSIGPTFASDGFIDADNSTRMFGAWTIEPQVGRRAMGAKYEDVVWLASDGTKTVI